MPPSFPKHVTPLSSFRQGHALPWWLAGLAASALLIVAGIAWQGAGAQRREVEAGLRKSAQNLALARVTEFTDRLEQLEALAPAVSLAWFSQGGDVRDWVFGPWPQPESTWDEWLARAGAAVRAGRMDEARSVLKEHALSTLTTADVTASGLPAAPLAARWAMLAAEEGEEKGQAAVAAWRAALDFPSPLTLALAEEAESVAKSRPTHRERVGGFFMDNDWHGQAGRLMEMRSALQAHGARIAAGASWVDGWHVKRDQLGKQVRIVRLADMVVEAGTMGIGKPVTGLPEDWLFQLAVDDFQLAGPAWERGVVMAEAAQGPVRVSVATTEPGRAFATLDKQLLRQRWLIGGAAGFMLTALGGFLVSLARQRRLNAMMSNFVASVSHELRAPVASMGLLSDRLGSGVIVDEAERAYYHQMLGGECRRISGTIENVLAFSRHERGRTQHEPELTDLNALTHDATGLVRLLASERGVEIQDNLPSTAIVREVDPVSLRQALLNLLYNALKFSPTGSTITVTLDDDATGTTLRVRDHGPGVPASERHRIFEPFYRIGSELRRETPGIGIGLAIVQGTALSHGGSVAVNDAPGGGAEFVLFLPLEPATR